MSLVVDASIALTWCFEDEATPETDSLFARIRDEGAIVPGIWRLELANVLLQAERRGRISGADVALRLELIEALPIAADGETAQRAWGDTLRIARSEQLTSYDAAYLELALREGAPLATRDRELADAARRRGLTVLP
jgi:predicted nucleic acid-binding protein